jgi:hypothetical protein
MFNERDLDQYGDYIDEVKKNIIDDNLKEGLTVIEEQIDIRHIDRKDKNDTWGFHYRIKNRYLSEYERWLGKPYISKYITLPDFTEWLRIKIINNREQQLEKLGL